MSNLTNLSVDAPVWIYIRLIQSTYYQTLYSSNCYVLYSYYVLLNLYVCNL